MAVQTDTVAPWLATMRELSSVQEYTGGADNPTILGWASFIGNRYPEMANYAANYVHDSIPWCGLTVAYALAKNGIKPVNEFLWARNWANFGTRVAEPRQGCIMVFTRDGGGHVAILERVEGNTFWIRGGNQSNAVNEQPRSRATFIAAVWPDQVAVQSTARTPEDVRVRMGKAIINFEARRDAQGRLAVFMLHPEDGGGTYEVAGINDRYHPVEAAKLKAMIEAGRQAEAEQFVGAFVASYTDVSDVWTNSWGIEFALRDQVFNRGPTGSARIMQRALISVGETLDEDGEVGPLTQAAMRRQESNIPRIMAALRASRESYERNPVGRDESSRFWKGLTNRWNNVTTIAQRFAAEQPKETLVNTEPGLPQPQPPMTTIDTDKLLEAFKTLAPLLPSLLPVLLPLLMALLNKGGQPIAFPAMPPLIEQPKPPEPPPPPPPVVTPPTSTPVLDRPGVGAGIFGTLGVILGQMFGVLPPAIGEQATTTGQVLPIITAGISMLGAAGWWGPLIKIGASLIGGLVSRANAPK